MRAFRQVTGIAVPLEASNVDTDQIVPKQFLKRVERTGFGQFLFYDWRFHPDGSPIPEFVLNQPRYAQAKILVAGRNFGCGSSREHAVWALDDFGFRAVIAPSFADIFAANALKNGLLPVVLEEPTVARLLDRVRESPGYKLAVDLEASEVRGSGFSASFAIDAFQRECLLAGLDEIGLTLREEAAIRRYEATQLATE